MVSIRSALRDPKWLVLTGIVILGIVEVFLPNSRLEVDKSPPIAIHAFDRILSPCSLSDWLYPLLLLILALSALPLLLLRNRLLYRTSDGATERSIARLDSYLGATALALILLAVWSLILGKLGILPWEIAPPPVVVVQALDTRLQDSTLLFELFRRIPRTGLSMAVSLIVAVPLALAVGLTLGRNRLLAGCLLPYVHLLSPMPPIILYPLMKLLFLPKTIKTLLAVLPGEDPAGLPVWFFDLLTPSMNISLTAWAIFWPVFAAALDGSRTANPRLISSTELLGARKIEVLRSVVFPQTIRHVLTNLNIGLIIGMIVLLFAESQEEPHVRSFPARLFLPTTGNLLKQSYDDLGVGAMLPIVFGVVVLVFTYNVLIARVKGVIAPWLRENLDPQTGTALHDSKPHGGQLLDLSTSLEPVKGFVERIRVIDSRVLAEGEVALYVRELSARFGSFILSIPALSIGHGEIVSIIGESGTGKSSFVELIVGARTPDVIAGTMSVNGRILYANGRRTSACSQLGVSFVYQDFVLLPHMRVGENLEFALRMRIAKATTSENGVVNPDARLRKELLTKGREAIEALLRFLGLAREKLIWWKFPAELSGGQRQRVALARALISAERMLILDEGLSSIDQPTKGDIRDGICRLASELKLTVLLVSHDNQDVLRISNRIVYMERHEDTACIAANTTPEHFFYQPSSAKAARFIGHRNIYLAELSMEKDQPIVSLTPVDGREGACAAKLRFVQRSQLTTKRGLALIPSSWVNAASDQGAGFSLGRILDEAFLGDSRELTVELAREVRLRVIISDDDYNALVQRLGIHLGDTKGKLLKDREVPFMIAREPSFIV